MARMKEQQSKGRHSRSAQRAGVVVDGRRARSMVVVSRYLDRQSLLLGGDHALPTQRDPVGADCQQSD